MTDRPTRIIFITNYRSLLPTRPYKNIFVEREFRAMREAGVDVEFFDIGVSHHPVKVFRSWRALKRRIRETNADLLHAQYGTIVSFVTTTTLHPSVVTYCGSDLLYGASVPPWRIYLGIFLSNVASVLAKGAICVTDELRRALWWRRRNVDVIPRGVNLHVFKPGSRADARRKLGWDAQKRIVLFMGARDPENKGQPLAEEAMRIVHEQMPDVEMHIAREVAPDEVPLYYAAANVLLFPSRQEGSPNVIKEALACNLPIVAVPVGDVEERLHGVKRTTVVPRNPRSVAEALIEMLRSDEPSDGRAHVEALSMEATAERIIAVYERVLGRPLVRTPRAESEPQLAAVASST
ncbi:MAG TPA: glycosyltransferase family 4 protein [Thermoanaerobaculia bacterium]|nr:glycosyltransferase family 4 protein [Thermoanaerobaculia bacterium]